MIGWMLKKIVGSRNQRLLKKYWPRVLEINRIEQGLQALSDEQLRAKTGRVPAAPGGRRDAWTS